MKNYYSSSFRLGMLGGGQLGRMLHQETIRLDISTSVLDPDANCPCAGIAGRFVQGGLKDFDTVYAFGKDCDVLTVEIEHVNVEALHKLAAEGVQVHPSATVLEIIQDKGKQKDFYVAEGIPTGRHFHYSDLEALRGMELTFPCVQKLCREGYDGRGVNILRGPSDLDGLPEAPGIIEEYFGDKIEISVMVARNTEGEIEAWPAVEMEFHPTANLVEYLLSPAQIGRETAVRAEQIALNTAEAFGLVGVMAVEMFVTGDGEIFVNESAPRPHNSGHQSIESCYTSQYEQHVRAILGLPLGSTEPRSAAVMINLLGAEGFSGPVQYRGVEEAMEEEGVYVHIYGKKETRPFRKMGHVTIVADTAEEAKEKARRVKSLIRVES